MAQPGRRFHLPSALRSSPARIAPESARRLVDGGALLVDVRRLDDDTTALAGAERIPPDMIPGRLASFRRDVALVLACT